MQWLVESRLRSEEGKSEADEEAEEAQRLGRKARKMAKR